MKKLMIFTVILICGVLPLACQNSTMTIREVFDYQPGDIFHFKIFSLYVEPPKAKRFEVIARNPSPGNDTICYTLKHFDYTSVYTGQLVYTHYHYTKNVCYTNLDSMVHTLLDTTGMVQWKFGEMTYLDSNLCDSLVYWCKAFYGDFEPIIIEMIFGRGLGITKYVYDYYFSLPAVYEHWELKYFKKGPYGCGTPDTVGLNINAVPDMILADRCKVYPNPASPRITLEFDPSAIQHTRTVSLLNPLGQQVLRESIPSGTQICTFNIDELPAGTYFLRIEGPESLLYSGKLVIQH